MPEIKAIQLKRIFWDIPRIDPVQFTAGNFATVIADTADNLRVEFLWLDVACIDQALGSREKAQEIGRQAKILGGATHVFVWLTTRGRSYYIDCLPEIEPQCELMQSPTFYLDVNMRVWVINITMILAELLSDP